MTNIIVNGIAAGLLISIVNAIAGNAAAVAVASMYAIAVATDLIPSRKR